MNNTHSPEQLLNKRTSLSHTSIKSHSTRRSTLFSRSTKLPTLHSAILSRDTASITKALNRKRSNINKLTPKTHMTALHYSIVEGYVEGVECLLESDKEKVDIEIPDGEGRTALLLAVIYGNIEIVELLLSKRRDVQLNVFDNFGCNALYYSIVNREMTILTRLIAKGGDVRWDDKEGKGLLEFAIEKCWDEGAVLLIENGVDVHRMVDGMTMLHLASKSDCKSAVECMLDRGVVDHLDGDGKTAVEYAVSDEMCKVFELFDARQKQKSAKNYSESIALESTSVPLKSNLVVNSIELTNSCIYLLRKSEHSDSADTYFNATPADRPTLQAENRDTIEHNLSELCTGYERNIVTLNTALETATLKYTNVLTEFDSFKLNSEDVQKELFKKVNDVTDKYDSLKKEYLELSISKEAQIVEMWQRMEALKGERDKALGKVESLGNGLERIREEGEAESKDVEIGELKGRICLLEGELEKSESENRELKVLIGEKVTEIENYKVAGKEQEELIEKLQREIQAKENESVLLCRENREFKVQIDENGVKMENYKAASIEQAEYIKRLETEIKGKENENVQLNHEINPLKDQLVSLDKKYLLSEANLKQAINRIEILENDIKTKQQEMDTLQKVSTVKIKSIETALVEKESAFNEFNLHISQSQQEIVELNFTLQQQQASIASLCQQLEEEQQVNEALNQEKDQCMSLIDELRNEIVNLTKEISKSKEQETIEKAVENSNSNDLHAFEQSLATRLSSELQEIMLQLENEREAKVDAIEKLDTATIALSRLEEDFSLFVKYSESKHADTIDNIQRNYDTELEEMSAAVASLETRANSLKVLADKKQKKVDALEIQLADVTRQFDENQREIKKLKEENVKSGMVNEMTTAELKEKNIKMTRLSTENHSQQQLLSSYMSRLEESEKKYDNYRQELDRVTSQYEQEIQMLTNRQDVKYKELIEYENEIGGLRDSYYKKDAMLQELIDMMNGIDLSEELGFVSKACKNMTKLAGVSTELVEKAEIEQLAKLLSEPMKSGFESLEFVNSLTKGIEKQKQVSLSRFIQKRTTKGLESRLLADMERLISSFLYLNLQTAQLLEFTTHALSSTSTALQRLDTFFKSPSFLINSRLDIQAIKEEWSNQTEAQNALFTRYQQENQTLAQNYATITARHENERIRLESIISEMQAIQEKERRETLSIQAQNKSLIVALRDIQLRLDEQQKSPDAVNEYRIDELKHSNLVLEEVVRRKDRSMFAMKQMCEELDKDKKMLQMQVEKYRLLIVSREETIRYLNLNALSNGMNAANSRKKNGDSFKIPPVL